MAPKIELEHLRKNRTYLQRREAFGAAVVCFALAVAVLLAAIECGVL